jgi:hypothetical protein
LLDELPQDSWVLPGWAADDPAVARSASGSASTGPALNASA